MKKGFDIVCLAFPSWRGDYMKSTVQLMKELAKTHNVLYVDYGYSWKDILLNTRHNKFIPVKRILGFESPMEKVRLGNDAFIHVLSLPPLIPFNWIDNTSLFKLIQDLNHRIIQRRVKSAMKKLDMVNPVIVNAFNPFLGASAYEDFNHKAAIYYCYDNIDAAVWASKHGSRLEQEFIQHVDAVVFSSEALQESKETGSKKSFVVHNGVDLTLFEKEMTCLAPPHSGQEKNICYIGSIDDRLDYDLLEKTILHFPRWNFHFIGRMMSNETERLKAFPNVKFYGAVDPKELPAMLKGCDAGIIPFVKNDFTKNIYPMKVNEYFAMGLPVVMTDFADIKDLADLVSVGNTESFITHLADEIDSDSAEKKSIRSHRVIQNSWKNKALEFENILLQYV